jgi:hypothetical protein
MWRACDLVVGIYFICLSVATATPAALVAQTQPTATAPAGAPAPGAPPPDLPSGPGLGYWLLFLSFVLAIALAIFWWARRRWAT